MRTPTAATLQHIVVALQAQDHELASARDEFARSSHGRQVLVDMRDLQLLRDACRVSLSDRCAPARFTGVRC